MFHATPAVRGAARRYRTVAGMIIDVQATSAKLLRTESNSACAVSVTTRLPLARHHRDSGTSCLRSPTSSAVTRRIQAVIAASDTGLVS